MSRKVELDFEDAQALYDAASSWLNELVEWIEPAYDEEDKAFFVEEGLPSDRLEPVIERVQEVLYGKDASADPR